MRSSEYYQQKENDLINSARHQDDYDLSTTNLIAPASPTLPKYINIPLRHASITEGLLGHRPYAGAQDFNAIESIAVETACDLFGSDHANVQLHSVSQANQAVYQALLAPGDKVLAMDFKDGGHLTHGMRRNFSGLFYDFNFYGVGADGLLDYNAISRQAHEFNPRLIVCGASSYPRTIDFTKLAFIAKETGARLMADLSHPAGLIVGGKFPNPFPHCDVVTLTLDKTMLGPHGGIILCKDELSQSIDKAVHPGVQSSVPLRRIYEIATCLIESTKPWFKDFISRIIQNTKAFEKVFSSHPGLMVSGGSDTHLMVLNTLKSFGLTGKEAESKLEEIGILSNRQVVPHDTQKPYVASGIRLGTTWITARGYTSQESEIVADILMKNLQDPDNNTLNQTSKKQLTDLLFIKRGNDVWKDEIHS